jgi:hypothetical protein
MPLMGYVILNAGVVVLTLAVYLVAKSGFLAPDEGTVPRPGLASVLLFIPLAFLVASVFDAIHDRVSARRGAALDDSPRPE